MDLDVRMKYISEAHRVWGNSNPKVQQFIDRKLRKAVGDNDSRLFNLFTRNIYFDEDTFKGAVMTVENKLDATTKKNLLSANEFFNNQ